ncbi:MAG TPA: DUF2203 domain-containing protein [Gemmataceae bacterium]|nr:DUF2203 domain-containing protein [Gemmataceae bacterium]
MAKKRVRGKKKYFTVAEANAALPLVRAVVSDITQLAQELRDRHERLSRVVPPERKMIGEAYREELEQVRADFERDQERMQEYVQELHKLGVELKDYFTGLVDFRCRLEDREVYLCWRLGEPEVAHWHELDAGFAGRKKLPKAEMPSAI